MGVDFQKRINKYIVSEKSFSGGTSRGIDAAARTWSGRVTAFGDDAVMVMVSLFAPVMETIKDVDCYSRVPCMQYITSYGPGCFGGTLL